MYEDYHNFYLELKRHRRLTLDEYQIELAMADEGDAWHKFKQVKRRLNPGTYITLTREQDEDFVNYWQHLYRDDEEGPPPITIMENPPTEDEIINSLHKLKKKKA